MSGREQNSRAALAVRLFFHALDHALGDHEPAQTRRPLDWPDLTPDGYLSPAQPVDVVLADSHNMLLSVLTRHTTVQLSA
jgi:hypothetical protein